MAEERNMVSEIMKMALNMRRMKVEMMLQEGYQLVDISRYFEVPLRSLKKSLKASKLPYEKNIVIYDGKIEDELEKRDGIIKSKGKNIQNGFAIGLWRIPKEFKKGKLEGDREKGLQTELRTIGIVPSDIAVYMGYADQKQVKAASPRVNHFLKEQIVMAKNLQDAGWTNEEIIEFCGISLRNLAKADEKLEVKIRENSKVRDYESIRERAKISYDLYSGNTEDKKKWSYQEIAEETGWSRQSVMLYVREYKREHNIIEKKRKSPGNKRKSSKDMKKVIEALQTKYLESGSDGKMVFREYEDENNKIRRYTIAKAAKELGVTEVTVVKYKKKLEEEIELKKEK